jgi:DNA repair protein RAD50
LKDIEARVRAADIEIRNQADRIATLREQIADLEKKEANSKSFERNVDDNIRFRKLKEEVKEIDNQIADKDLAGANKAKEAFDREYEQGRRKLQELQGQQANITGELAMSKSTLEERRSELESEYKDVQKLYTRQLIKVKTAEFAVQDLEKYGKALDKYVAIQGILLLGRDWLTGTTI